MERPPKVIRRRDLRAGVLKEARSWSARFEAVVGEPYQPTAVRGLTVGATSASSTGVETPPRPVPAITLGRRPRHRQERGSRPLLWTWLATFGVLFVAVAAWSFSSPLGSGPDEPAHLVRAASLVRGQLLGTPLAHPTNAEKSWVTVRVPEVFAALENDVGCFQFKPAVPAGCQQPLNASTKEVLTQTYVGRYPPFYYALVGLPTLFLVSVKGIYAARLVSGALAAALLALAMTSLRRCRGAPLLGAGVAVAVTPMALYMAAIINPSGLEIAASISAWVAAMALLSEPAGGEAGPFTSATSALGLSIVVLLLTRALSPLWALAILVVIGVAGPPRSWRDLLRRRHTQAWIAACAVAAVCALVWDLRADPFLTEPGTRVSAHASETQVVMLALERLDLIMTSSIGYFGWLSSPSPEGVIVVWLAVFGVVVLVGACLARARGVLALGGTLVAWLALPVAVTLSQARTEGILGQGRDYLGLAVGIPIVAGAIAGERFAQRRSSLRLVSIVVTAVLACQVADFYSALRRNTVGITGPIDAFLGRAAGQWSPPLPGILLFVAFSLAMVAFAVLLRTSAASQRESPGMIEEVIIS